MCFMIRHILKCMILSIAWMKIDILHRKSRRHLICGFYGTKGKYPIDLGAFGD